jgi:hypothetical protein
MRLKLFVAMIWTCALSASLFADGPGRIQSKKADADFPLTADPSSSHWRGVKPIVFGNDTYGKPVPGHRTEVRSRWTRTSLYVLFTAHYNELYMNEKPNLKAETNKLWDHDVCEMFIGSTPQTIAYYKEFQVSPQGEYVDLEINRAQPKNAGGLGWNSMFQVKARIDAKKKIWYGEMKIPIDVIDVRDAKVGNEMRVNFYRMQGPPPKRLKIAWQPTNSETFHVPESFGTIILDK